LYPRTSYHHPCRRLHVTGLQLLCLFYSLCVRVQSSPKLHSNASTTGPTCSSRNARGASALQCECKQALTNILHQPYLLQQECAQCVTMEACSHCWHVHLHYSGCISLLQAQITARSSRASCTLPQDCSCCTAYVDCISTCFQASQPYFNCWRKNTPHLLQQEFAQCVGVAACTHQPCQGGQARVTWAVNKPSSHQRTLVRLGLPAATGLHINTGTAAAAAGLALQQMLQNPGSGDRRQQQLQCQALCMANYDCTGQHQQAVAASCQ
jgi:hypothetical protein